MKKQLIKEISDLNKLLKNEKKANIESNDEIMMKEGEINVIEEKFKSVIKDVKKYNEIPKISALKKLYETYKKTNKEKTFIENNLIKFKKENEGKEQQLQKYFKDLLEKETKNDELIEKKVEELTEEYDKVERKFNEDVKQDQYIISPETMSIHMISKITTEIEFLDLLRKQTKTIKIKNDKILKDIEAYFKKLKVLKSKKESSVAELSTAAKISSNLERKNYNLKDLENFNNNDNININNMNNDQDSISSISMEIETNLNLDKLPSDDESLRFIDRVFDVKSNIKPIKNKLKTQFFPPSASISMDKTKKAEPIKIERPIDYKSKNENIEKEVDDIKKDIENKRRKIEQIKERKKKLRKKIS